MSEKVRSIDSLDFDDMDDDINQSSYQESGNEPYMDRLEVSDEPLESSEQSELSNQDLIETLLKEKGITDINSISFLDENNEEIKVPFADLDLETQLNILKTPTETSDNDLNEDEISVINFLRENNISRQQYEDYIAYTAVENYLKENQQITYKVSDFTDDELFVEDLKNLHPDLTEDEIAAELEYVKGNPAIYERRVKVLRDHYEQLEKEQLEEEQLAAEQEQLEEFNRYKETIVGVLDGLNLIGEFELEQNDKEELSEFILGEDKTGVRYLAKAINDPQTLVKMAWFALKGEEALNMLSDYYKKEISKRSVGKSTKTQAPITTTVVKQANKSNNNNKLRSIDELVID